MLQPLIDLRGAGTSLTPQRARLLQALDAHGSISAAARAVGMSYKGAWDAISALNEFAGEPLVTAEAGGSGGGGARLTDMGRRVLAFHDALTALQNRLLSGHGGTGRVENIDDLLRRLGNLMLRTSARNQFEGTVQAIQRGAVNSEVVLDLDGGDQLVAIITNRSVDDLGLREGGSAIALVKSSFVVLGEPGVRTSARNALAGTVLSCREGAVNAEVELQLAGGRRLVATVTNESAKELGIREGVPMLALVKSSHVILAVAV
ncbi:TOBE domain-containing protein [Thermomonas paludicola]|uniref:TOBE domain-containing protein n=1 Tax=Thermomonas paludicola TaxID=2884874 RepID=UPI0021150F32|nr:TOBE domain-containing protein [Thermomonas paludicola]